MKVTPSMENCKLKADNHKLRNELNSLYEHVEDIITATYQSYTMLGLLTIIEDLKLDGNQISKFDAGVKSRLELHQKGKLTYDDIVAMLADYDIYMENIHYKDTENGKEIIYGNTKNNTEVEE